MHLFALLLQAAQTVVPDLPKHASASPLGTQITVASLIVWALEYLKDKKWAPFVKRNAATLNKISSGVVAFIAALGVTYTWDATNHQIVIANIPTLAGFVTVCWTWVKQFTFQELAYRGFFQKNGQPPANP